MNDDLITWPWREIERCSFEPWRVVIRVGRTEVTLRDHEVLDLCAAVEEGRVCAGSVAALLARRARRRRRWEWSDLAQGAMGITRAGAPCTRTIGEVFGELGLEFVKSQVRKAPNEKPTKEAA